MDTPGIRTVNRNSTSTSAANLQSQDDPRDVTGVVTTTSSGIPLPSAFINPLPSTDTPTSASTTNAGPTDSISFSNDSQLIRNLFENVLASAQGQATAGDT